MRYLNESIVYIYTMAYLSELSKLVFREVVRPALEHLHHLCATLDLYTASRSYIVYVLYIISL